MNIKPENRIGERLTWFETLGALAIFALFIYGIYVVVKNILFWLQYKYYQPQLAFPQSRLCIFSLQLNCISCFWHQGNPNFYQALSTWTQNSHKYWSRVLYQAAKIYQRLIKSNKVSRKASNTLVDYSKYDRVAQLYSDVYDALIALGYRVDSLTVRTLVFQFEDKSVDEIVQKAILVLSDKK